MNLAFPKQSYAKAGIVGLAALLAIFFGFATAIDNILTLQVLALIAVLAFHFKLPQYSIAPFLLASFYIASYTMVDVAALLFFASATVYMLKRRSWKELRHSTLVPPLAVIAILVILSTLAAFMFEKTIIKDIYRDGRIFVYWLLLIPLLAWTPRRSAPTWLANNMLFIGVCVCVLAIVQGSLGVRLVQTGLVADLDTMSTNSMSTVRVQIPGFMFAMFALTYITALLLGRVRAAIPLLILFCVLSLGIIFNFGRALWFWTFVSLVILAVQYGARGLMRFFAWVTIPALIGLAALGVVKPELFDTIGTRITSVADEGGVGSSFGWRELEMQEGMKSLRETHFLGVGMGGTYRRFNEMLANFPDHTIYTHNGHLYLALKLSVFGLLAYWWLGARAIQTIAKSPRRTQAEQAVARSAIAFTVAFFGINFTQPEIMSHYGLVAFVFICGIALFLHARGREEATPRAFRDTVPSPAAAS